MFSQKSYQQSSISTEGTTRLASHRVRFGFGKYSPSILDIVATVDSYQKADCKTNMSIRFHGALLVVFMSARASSSGHLPFNMKSGCLIELRVHISELPPARSMKPPRSAVPRNVWTAGSWTTSGSRQDRDQERRSLDDHYP